MEIILPNGDDIYALGFDKGLSRVITGIDSNVVYNSIDDQTPAQVITLGGLMAGAANTMVAMDPAKGLWLGAANFENAPFRVNMAGDMAASSGVFSGSITATSGTIGGFTVGTDFIKDAADSMGLASTVTGGDDVRFWAGSTFANRATAPFRVTEAGAVTGSSITITGGAISATPISAIPNSTATDISLLEKTHDMTFTSASATQVNWTSGTVTLSNGRTFSISSGNTGAMAALTYIYIDPAVSSTVMQKTTTATTAMGANKVLIGTAQNNTVGASYIPYGPGQPLVDGANINALSIVAGNIAASTITAAKLTVSQLSAIAADMGTITAGTITGATIRTSSSNPKFTMNSTTFQGINSAGTVTFEIVISGVNAGDVTMGSVAGGKYAQWDDSAGTFNVYSNNSPIDIQTFNASGTWTKPSTGTYARIQIWGPGGSGAASNNTATRGAGGGGGGEYSELTVLISSLGSTETVTIGTGGAGVTVGTGTNGNPGSGSSSFGTWISAGAGQGGTEAAAGGEVAGAGGDTLGFGTPAFGTSVAPNGIYSAAGGVNADGGKTLFGGAGGGGVRGSATNGGTSKSGGNGGASSITNGVNGGTGVAPGGGGGAFNRTGGGANSGAGANGRCIVSVF